LSRVVARSNGRYKIGPHTIGAYREVPRLLNPRNDAEDVAAALARNGFETIVGLDLDKAGWKRKRSALPALRTLQSSITAVTPCSMAASRHTDLDAGMVAIRVALHARSSEPKSGQGCGLGRRNGAAVAPLGL
jgi:hypothetical protein